MNNENDHARNNKEHTENSSHLQIVLAGPQEVSVCRQKGNTATDQHRVSKISNGFIRRSSGLRGFRKTKTIADIAETARKVGGRIALITSNRESPIAKISDSTVIIENQRDKVGDETAEFEVRQMIGEHGSFAPLGTLFETAAWFSQMLVFPCSWKYLGLMRRS
jgi:hypothetical protein